MKIVMLCDLYDEELQYQENLLGKYYVKHGHEVTVVASTFKDAFAYYADKYDPAIPATQTWDGGVKVIKLPYSLNLLNRLRRFGGVARLLDRERPDLIFVHDIHLNLSDAAAYRRRHPACKIIMDYHADYTNSAKNWISLNILHRVIRRRFLYRYKKYIDKIYPVVPISATFLHEVYGIDHSEMDLLPLGVDSDVARQVRQANSGRAIRSSLSIPADAVVIFTGGKLDPLKETHILFEAFNKLADPRLHLLVVGDSGPAHADYKRLLVEQRGGNPRIHFVGWVDGLDVYKYMSACDFAVFPASQSVLWQQALSMGLPLIVGMGSMRGNQDPSYMNPYGNITIIPRDQITGDVIAREIRTLCDDRAGLAARQQGALRAAGELLDYDKLVMKTLTF